MLFSVRYIEPSNRRILTNAKTKPNFKIAIEPVRPNREISNGLQNGQVVAKKLINMPVVPVVVEI